MSQFHLFLPQMRMTPEVLVARTQAAEAAGFNGIALMDHLVAPLAEDQPAFEAMVMATWLAARTHSLTIGHLVLCDGLRHPAVLAKQAVSLDHASEGRFELGLGWGSYPEELEAVGLGATPGRRVRRLAETLEVVKALWSGERVDFEGECHQLRGASQRPLPLSQIPILIGGAGTRTLELVAAHADWWNVPLYALDQLDELRGQAGEARVSIQEMIGFVRSDQAAGDVAALAARRFGGGPTGPRVGDAAELVDHFGGLWERGVERFYVWFTDFADPATLEEFGATVIKRMPAETSHAHQRAATSRPSSSPRAGP